MFKIQLTALGYPFPNNVNAEDPQHFRKCIHWLEDLKIRHYPIENRDGLRKVDSPVEWYVAYKSYKIDLAVPYLTTTADELEWFLNKAIFLEYEDLESFPKFPISNINTYDKDFVECIQKMSKEFKLRQYREEEYTIQIKDIAYNLKKLINFQVATPDEFKKVEQEARILKLLELQGIKKTLNEKIKKETLEEIKNDSPSIEPKKIEPKVIVPTISVPIPTISVPQICPPPPTFDESKIVEPSLTGTKIMEPTSEPDTDCFIVEEKSDIPPIILKTVQPEAKLDLTPIIRNILTKLSNKQLKLVCKDARYKNGKKTRNNKAADVIIDGVIALPETVTPIKPVLTQKLIPKPALAQNSGPKPVVVQKPVVRSIQNQFPQTNGNGIKLQRVPQPTMKRSSTPVPIKAVDKKPKIEDAQPINPLKVFIYNEAITGGKITQPQFLILTQKLLQVIDEDTSKNAHLIRFDRYKLENGIYAITCANEFAKNWLEEKIKLMDNLWPFAALRITENKLNIISQTSIQRLSVFVPGPVAEPALTILKRINRQNPTLKTVNWKIIGHYPKKNNGVQLVVGLDDEAFKAIQLVELRPYYGLTRITFREKFNDLK